MKIAIGKIFQETNTFSPVPYTLDDFKRFGIYFGNQILERSRGIGEIGGFIYAAEIARDAIELLPILDATAWAGGRITAGTWEYLLDKLISGLLGLNQVDGVLLSLHGAMAAVGFDDTVGQILATVRNIIKDDIPLVATLDHHANITKLMVNSADALVGYRECPHTDTFETGVRGAELLFSIIRGDISPTVGWQKIPMITPIEKFWTSEPPLMDWFAMATEMENHQDVLSVSLFPVQPWLDVPELGWSTLVVTNNNQQLAQKLATKLAKRAWQMRDEFFEATLLSPEDAIKEAVATRDKPVVIADGSDNMNSGAPGDSTCLLMELVKQKINCEALLMIVDPEAVEKALEFGIRSTVKLSVGGKRDNIFSHPVQVTGDVTRISDGRIMSSGHLPISFDMGRTVLLKIGMIRLVITEFAGPSHEPAVFQHLGQDPRKAGIVVVKTPVGFRVAYKSIMRRAITVNCPGLSTSNLKSLNFVKVPHPLYPLDEISDWHVSLY